MTLTKKESKEYEKYRENNKMSIEESCMVMPDYIKKNCKLDPQRITQNEIELINKFHRVYVHDIRSNMSHLAYHHQGIIPLKMNEFQTESVNRCQKTIDYFRNMTKKDAPSSNIEILLEHMEEMTELAKKDDWNNIEDAKRALETTKKFGDFSYKLNRSDKISSELHLEYELDRKVRRTPTELTHLIFNNDKNAHLELDYSKVANAMQGPILGPAGLKAKGKYNIVNNIQIFDLDVNQDSRLDIFYNNEKINITAESMIKKYISTMFTAESLTYATCEENDLSTVIDKGSMHNRVATSGLDKKMGEDIILVYDKSRINTDGTFKLEEPKDALYGVIKLHKKS